MKGVAAIAMRSARIHQSHCHKERNMNMRAKIFKGTVLLITDDTHTQTLFEDTLLRAGYGVRTARDQQEAIEELRFITPAIIVVDRRQSGFSRLSQESSVPPPIVTFSYHAEPCDEQHCVMDLEDGATRAVCNTSPALIVGLLGAVLRRLRWDQLDSAPTRYVSHGVAVDLENCEVKVENNPVNVSRTEFLILQSLIAAPGHYLTRKQLLNQVWGEGFAIYPHVLDVHVCSLRHKLDPVRTSPELITTIKGSGFRLRSESKPAQIPFVQANRAPALMMLPRVSNANPQLAQRVRSSMGGSIHWSPQRTSSVSARYRSTPPIVSPGLHNQRGRVT